MIRGRVARGVGANIVDKTVIAVMQLALVPIQASHWGSHLYGIWTVMAAIPALIAFSDFGFATAAGTRMTMEVARNDRASASRTFDCAVIAVSAIALVIIALGSLAIWSVFEDVLPSAPGFSYHDARMTLTILLIYSMLCLQNSVSYAGFRCDGYLHVGVLSHSATYFAENLAMIGAITLGAGPLGAATALVITRAAAMAVQRLLMRRLLPWLRLGIRWTSLAELRALFSPANSVMAMLGAQTVLLQGSALALSAAASPAAVPVFTTVRTLTRLILAVTALFGNSTLPEFSAAAARRDVPRRAQLLVVTFIASAVVCVPIICVLLFFGPWIVSVWTRGVVHPTYPLMWTMCASVLLTSFWLPAANYLMAISQQSRYAYTYLLVAIAAVVATYGLSRSLGALGAAVGLLSTDVIMSVVIWRLLYLLEVDAWDLREAAQALMARLTAGLRRRTAT